MKAPLREFEQQKSYRLINSKFPLINLYEDLAASDQLDAVYAIEAASKPRLIDQIDGFSTTPKEDQLSALPNYSYVMAAFSHLSKEGQRFNANDFGSYYCADDLNTCIKETVYHTERINGYTQEPAQTHDMRAIVATFSANLIDISGAHFKNLDIYKESDYSASQAFGSTHRNNNQDGIYYRSVRRQGHTCFALFKPALISKITQGMHFEYVWDGHKVANVFKKTLVTIND